MNLEKLKPWNWFKHENIVNNDNRQIPVVRNEAGSVNPVSNTDSFFRLHREMDRLIDDMLNTYGMPGVSFSFPHNRLHYPINRLAYGNPCFERLQAHLLAIIEFLHFLQCFQLIFVLLRLALHY